MWKDLTLKEKAEIMKMSVASGVTDINDIQELYDDSIYAEGGHLYDKAGPLNKAKQQPKYQYGIIEQILRENGVNFRVTSGVRKPNQAGNAGKSSAHTYTIFGNSPGAIDIVPGVGSDWGTLFAQMNSPKVRRALAMYGLDVLNETNPSVMASTHATGPHLHVGRGIKGQSGAGVMYGGVSFGGGKSSIMPQYSGGSDYTSMMQQQAMEPITLAGSNATSPWLDYIGKIGQQRPVTFNTSTGTANNLVSNNQLSIGPVNFDNIGSSEELMSFNPYTRKQDMEYSLGLENNALWNSPYLLFNAHSAANGGHLFDDGSMLLKGNDINPAYRYVYGDDYEAIVRQNREAIKRGPIRARNNQRQYSVKQESDIVANTSASSRNKIRLRQIDSPTRRQTEQAKADAAHQQYLRERQGNIGTASNLIRHPDYNPQFANEVQRLREQEAKEEQKAYNRRVLESNVIEGLEAIPWPSTVAGSLFNPNTHWYDPGSFFTNLYANDNRGFFNINQATRDFYDANPEVGGIANLIGDFVVPGAAAKALKGVSRVGKFATADIGNAWKTMRYELAHPEAQTLGILPKEFNIPGFKMPIISEEALSKAGEQSYWNSLIDKVEELPLGETRWQAGQALDRMRRLVKNEASNSKLLEAVEQARGNTTADDIMQFVLGRPIKYKTSTEGIERFEGSTKIPTPSRRNTYIDEPRTMHWVGDDYVPIIREKVDDIPNLRQTIDAIEKNIKDEDIIPQFLDGSYISAFKNEAAQQGIDVSSLSNNTIAKILTEQYKQLSSSGTGALKNNVLWRSWGNDYPASIFDWQTHIGKSTGNLGFWGQGNYFGTGNYRGVMENRPYMITGIEQLAYDSALGPTDAVEGLKAADALDRFNVLGARPGRADIATRWMSESPETRMVVATPDGLKNTYGVLDTGERGIEVVTQKNTGIKSLVPDFRIGNGETFPRDWNNPNVHLSPDYSKFSFTTGDKTFDIKLFEDFLNGRIESPTQVPKSVPTKSIPKNATFEINTDKRLKLSLGSPSSILATDIGKLTEAEVEAMFGPRAVYWKKMYDVAKNHNFEGKFKAIGEQAEREIRSRFSINREDPDVKVAIDKAKRLYDIPEYRARFEKFGTLGDTFIDDALNRIKNMELQGVSKDYKIIGQHGVEGGASAEAHPISPKVTIKDSDSSKAIQELTQHEVNHAAHGMKYQPEWMKYHNERIRPKPRRESNTPGAKYMNEMDEIVERAKTTVEWADRIRKPGESLNDVLSRIVDDFENLDGFGFAKKYKNIPGDTKSYLLFFEPKTGKRFLQNFVGSFIVGTTGMSIVNQ